MRASFVHRLIAASAILLSGTASALPVLETATRSYVYGVDFEISNDTGFGDVTAPLRSIDLVVPPTPIPNGSDSGCDAGDFAGFAAGSIALIQRGTCGFNVKVLNAIAAGAVGVLLFNEGQPGRTDLLDPELGAPSTIPVFFATFDVGAELSFGFGTNLRMAVTAEDVAAAVPAPGSLALAGLGLLALAGVGQRRRAARRADA